MKNAFVTGGGRGIGAGIVEALASESWNVVFCGRKSVAEMETRREQIEREYGVRALYLQCDVSNGDDRRLAVDSALEAFGELNALVNNAGVAPLVRADILGAADGTERPVFHTRIHFFADRVDFSEVCLEELVALLLQRLVAAPRKVQQIADDCLRLRRLRGIEGTDTADDIVLDSAFGQA